MNLLILTSLTFQHGKVNSASAETLSHGSLILFPTVQGLKNHAVTMFEVGKLTDESLDSFITELGKVPPTLALSSVGFSPTRKK